MKLDLNKIALTIAFLLISTITNAQWKDLNSDWIGAVKSINTSPDGNIISVQGEDNIHLFDGNTYRQLWVLKLSIKPTNHLFISNEDLLVFGNSKSLLANIYTRSVSAFSSEIFNLGAFDSTNNKIYLVTSTNQLKVFSNDLGNLKFISSRQLDTKCTAISLSPSYIQIGYNNGYIDILRKLDLTTQTTLKGHKTHISCMSMDTSQNILVSGASRDYDKGEFGEAILWNIKSGDIIFRTDDRHKQVLSTYIDNFNRVFISNLRGVNIYNFSGQPITEISPLYHSNPIFRFHRGKMIYTISDVGHTSENLYIINTGTYETEQLFSHDSRQVWGLDFYQNFLVVKKDNEVSIIEPGNKVTNLKLASRQSNQNNGQIFGFEIPADGQPKKELFIYSVADKAIQTIPLSDNFFENKFSFDFLKTPKGIYAISNSHLYDLSEKKNILDFTVPPIKIDSTLFKRFNKNEFFNIQNPHRYFIPNTNMFYEIDDDNYVLNLRNMENGMYIKQFKQVAKVLNLIGDKLYVMNQITKMVDAVDLKKLVLEPGVIRKSILPYQMEITQIKYSNNKKYAAIKNDYYGNKISIVHLDMQKEIRISPSAMHVDCFEFTPNNKYLLTGNRLGEIEVWDVATGGLKGVLFTGSLKNDYIILSGKQMDGTPDGIKYFISQPQNYQKVNGLYEMLFLK